MTPDSRREKRWVARLRPTGSTTIEALIRMPLGLYVWERHAGELVVAAGEGPLEELERRQLAEVERIVTVEEYVADRGRLLGQESQGGSGDEPDR